MFVQFRFLDLSSILEPGKSAKTDKLAILGDAIRVLNQLRNEANDLEDANEKLQEEIRSLKVRLTRPLCDIMCGLTLANLCCVWHFLLLNVLKTIYLLQ